MSLSLYDTSVASYQQVLGGVANILDKGAQHAAEAGLDLEELARFKLRDDMLPFSFQLISCWHHSLNAIKGIKAGEFAPPPKMSDMTYSKCQALVAEAIEGLQDETPEEINALADKPLIFRMGGNEIPFTAANFIISFSLPNFYFHATTTYDMLRMHGVPLGKMDYLGAIRVGGPAH